jgi:hypothetical protein
MEPHRPSPVFLSAPVPTPHWVVSAQRQFLVFAALFCTIAFAGAPAFTGTPFFDVASTFAGIALDEAVLTK